MTDNIITMFRRAAGDQSPELPTEDDAAQRFAASVVGQMVYDHTSSCWYIWRGDRWQADEKGEAFRRVLDFVREMRAEFPGQKLGKIAFSASVERAAKVHERIAVSQTMWDRDPWRLGVPGGVVDLRSGKLEPGAPDQYISRQCLVAPSESDCPMWRAFLEDVTRGDAEVMAFLQRLAGYALTGDVSEEMLAFIYGPGGNGKGVFVGVVTAIMHQYAIAMPIEAFTGNSRLPLEYYRAQMAGARLVTASETEAGTAWSEAQIKELTGNEAPVSARNPYGKPFTYRPQFKLCIVGNHAPRLKGRSPAMERRLRIVPFVHEPTHPDPDLKTKLVPEYGAILRWMVDGCLMWQRDRLGNAEAIRQATGDYFESQDTFRRWLEERCIRDAALKTKPGTLYSDYKAWAAESGEAALGAPEFAEQIGRTRGLKRTKYLGTRLIVGVGLKAPSQDIGWDQT